MTDPSTTEFISRFARLSRKSTTAPIPQYLSTFSQPFLNKGDFLSSPLQSCPGPVASPTSTLGTITEGCRTMTTKTRRKNTVREVQFPRDHP